MFLSTPGFRYVTLTGGRIILEFYYLAIELRKLKPDDFRRMGRPGLSPLMILTDGGATRDIAQEIFTTLESTGNETLLPVAFTLASLAFGKDNIANQEWLQGSYKMHDILKETPIFQEMTKDAREAGLQQGLLSIIAERFPKLVRLAKKQIAVVEEPEILQRLIGKISVAQTLEEARQHLLEVDQDEEDM